MRRFLAIGVAIALVLAIFAPLSLAKGKGKGEKNPDVAPEVSITSPEEWAVISEDTLEVVVEFGPKEKGKGNVRNILLYLDEAEVARYENPANIKEGSHTFTVQTLGLEDGQEYILQAFAYMGAVRGGHMGASNEVGFTFFAVSERLLEMEEGLYAGDWEKIAENAAVLGDEIGEPAVPKLVEGFEDPVNDEILRKMFGEIIAHIKDSRAIEPLIEVLTDESETDFIRAEAAFNLGQIGDEAVIDPLIQALSYEGEQVRSMSAFALGFTGSNLAVEPLIGKLSDPSKLVRIRTIRALGMLKDGRAVEPLINLLGDEDEDIVGQASSALGAIGDIRAVNPLLNVISEGTEFKRTNAIKALGQIGSPVLQFPDALELLRSILQGEDEYDAMNAGLALAEIGDMGAVDILVAAIERAKDEFVQTKLKEAYKTLTGGEYP